MAQAEDVDLSAPEPAPTPLAPIQPPRTGKPGTGGLRPGARMQAPATGSPNRPQNPAYGSLGRPPQGGSVFGGPRAEAGAGPQFKFYFDLWLIAKAGVDPVSFDSQHTLVLVEYAPTSSLLFTAELNPTPRYFQAEFELNPRVKVRAGKIWIPFDEMAPHANFGGRMTVSALAPTSVAFLPNIWTDLGVGLDYKMVENRAMTLLSQVYVVNGFRSGGTDPLNPSAGATAYPSFSDLPISSDNNSDKAIGGRLSTNFGGKFGLGASVYSGRWSNQSSAPLRVLAYGADGNLNLSAFLLRAGLISMKVDLPSASMLRAGSYVEAGPKLMGGRLKILARAGTLQLDDRVVDANDQKLVGGAVIYRAGNYQLSVEQFRDLDRSIPKANLVTSWLRLAILL